MQMDKHAHRAASSLAALGLLLTSARCAHEQYAQPSTAEPTSMQPTAANGVSGSPLGNSMATAAKQDEHASAAGTEVLLCDGQTKVTVAPGTPGTSVAGALMSEWLRKNPNANWEAEERERHTLQPAADNAALVGQVQGQTYGRVTEQDVSLWKAEAERTALAGSQVFHSGDQLGSTVGVSCDMCHPHGANTHPETYPKYQAQLGRVALLRDMINWCIEHPVRGKVLDADDPKMRSLEAYILAQRKGHALDYGKH
jgi:thiosulfate dehydrogenase